MDEILTSCSNGAQMTPNALYKVSCQDNGGRMTNEEEKKGNSRAVSVVRSAPAFL